VPADTKIELRDELGNVLKSFTHSQKRTGQSFTFTTDDSWIPGKRVSVWVEGREQADDEALLAVGITGGKSIYGVRREDNKIAYTMDCGSSADNVPYILDLLDEFDLKITFFVTGQFAKNNRELVSEMAARGHEIGNHSWSHPSFYDLKGDHYVMSGGGFDAYTCGRHWIELERCFDVSSIGMAIDNAAICKMLGYSLEMIPLTGEDGAAVAEVTEYGAINSTTETPELAYQFLRMFLTEEVQWEKNASYSMFTFDDRDGYCVRTVGSVQELLPYKWEKARTISSSYQDIDGNVYNLPETELEFRDTLIAQLQLTDADIPILDVTIGEARFPIGDFADQFGWRFNRECVDHPDELNWDAVADQYIRDLQDYMMAE